MKKLFDALFSPEKLLEWEFGLLDLLRRDGRTERCRETIFE